MQDFQETRMRSFVSAFSICMTLPLRIYCLYMHGVVAIQRRQYLTRVKQH